MSNLSIFNFNQSPVKLLIQDETPFFNLIDVCDVFGIQNSRRVLSEMLDSKGVRHTYTLAKDNKRRKLAFISEPNLYRIIFRSDKPVAIDFQNWVFDEVLPTIRKTGSYSLTINTEQQQLIQQAVNERAFRTGENHKSIYIKLHKEFKIPRYAELPASKFNDAIKFLGGVKNNNCVLISLDDLKRQYNYLASIQEYYNRVFEQYNNHLAEFVGKNIPHLHYNISTALGVIQFNTCKSIDLLKGRLGKPQRNRVINFEADIAYLD